MKHISTKPSVKNEDLNNMVKIVLLQLVSVAVLVAIRLI